MNASYRIRRMVVVTASLAAFVMVVAYQPNMYQPIQFTSPTTTGQVQNPVGGAADALDKLLVKGRAPKTDYARTQFGAGWASSGGCDTS
ncbi:MAG: hypothetical protein ABIR91_05050, partial [Candidatus Saccharimonadales bacterium]